MPEVVVLPWVPATAIARLRRETSPSSSPRWITGPSAAASSGLSGGNRGRDHHLGARGDVGRVVADRGLDAVLAQARACRRTRRGRTRSPRRPARARRAPGRSSRRPRCRRSAAFASRTGRRSSRVDLTDIALRPGRTGPTLAESAPQGGADMTEGEKGRVQTSATDARNAAGRGGGRAGLRRAGERGCLDRGRPRLERPRRRLASHPAQRERHGAGRQHPDRRSTATGRRS